MAAFLYRTSGAIYSPAFAGVGVSAAPGSEFSKAEEAPTS